MHRVLPLGLALLALTAGCSSPKPRDLEASVRFFNEPGRTIDELKALYSARSSANLSDDMVQGSDAESQPVAVDVLRETDVEGARLAVVSVTLRRQDPNGGSCEDVITQTWSLESGAWKFVTIRGLYEQAWEQLRIGNHGAAVATLERALDVNPYSTFAYHALITATHTALEGNEAAWRERHSEIVRAMMSINQDDHRSIDAAMTTSENLTVAKAFLDQLKGSCLEADASQRYAMRIEDPDERLAFLDSIGAEGGPLSLLRVMTLARAERTEEAWRLVEANAAQIRSAIDAEPSGTAPHSAGLLAALALQVGQFDAADRWIAFGLRRDPTSETLTELLQASQVLRANAKPSKN